MSAAARDAPLDLSEIELSDGEGAVLQAMRQHIRAASVVKMAKIKMWETDNEAALSMMVGGGGELAHFRSLSLHVPVQRLASPPDATPDRAVVVAVTVVGGLGAGGGGGGGMTPRIPTASSAAGLLGSPIAPASTCGGGGAPHSEGGYPASEERRGGGGRTSRAAAAAVFGAAASRVARAAAAARAAARRARRPTAAALRRRACGLRGSASLAAGSPAACSSRNSARTPKASVPSLCRPTVAHSSRAAQRRR